MSLTQFTEILDAIRGISLGPREADELRAAIDCRVGAPPKSTATAECALAAVYAAIEAQAGHQDANLAGLAALVNALKPRTPLPTGGQVYVNNDVPGSAAARLKQIQDRT
ncbi:hypothetical protein GQ649_26205 [Rhodococcus sp. DSM 6344]|nr:hypothetical protein [Rhodococcus erythropolis]